MGCYGIKDLKKKLSPTKLPPGVKNINNVRFYELFPAKMFNYLLIKYDLHVYDADLWKVMATAYHYAFENENGRITHEDLYKQNQSFFEFFVNNFPTEFEFHEELKRYFESDEFKPIREEIKKIRDFRKRAEIYQSIALSYLFAKRHKVDTVVDTFAKLEKYTIVLPVLKYLWGKKWFWFATTLLAFSVDDMEDIAFNKSKFHVHGLDYDEMKILGKVYKWYDIKQNNLSIKEKLLGSFYDNILVPVVGEVGSVFLSDAVKDKAIVPALYFLANALTILASFHPYFRALSLVARVSTILAQFLDETILGWLGWQVAVEWTLDGWLQIKMMDFKNIVFSKGADPTNDLYKMYKLFSLIREKYRLGYLKGKDLEEYSSLIDHFKSDSFAYNIINDYEEYCRNRSDFEYVLNKFTLKYDYNVKLFESPEIHQKLQNSINLFILNDVFPEKFKTEILDFYLNSFTSSFVNYITYLSQYLHLNNFYQSLPQHFLIFKPYFYYKNVNRDLFLEMLKQYWNDPKLNTFGNQSARAFLFFTLSFFCFPKIINSETTYSSPLCTTFRCVANDLPWNSMEYYYCDYKKSTGYAATSCAPRFDCYGETYNHRDFPITHATIPVSVPYFKIFIPYFDYCDYGVFYDQNVSYSRFPTLLEDCECSMYYIGDWAYGIEAYPRKGYSSCADFISNYLYPKYGVSCDSPGQNSNIVFTDVKFRFSNIFKFFNRSSKFDFNKKSYIYYAAYDIYSSLLSAFGSGNISRWKCDKLWCYDITFSSNSFAKWFRAGSGFFFCSFPAYLVKYTYSYYYTEKEHCGKCDNFNDWEASPQTEYEEKKYFYTYNELMSYYKENGSPDCSEEPPSSEISVYDYNYSGENCDTVCHVKEYYWSCYKKEINDFYFSFAYIDSNLYHETCDDGYEYYYREIEKEIHESEFNISFEYETDADKEFLNNLNYLLSHYYFPAYTEQSVNSSSTVSKIKFTSLLNYFLNNRISFSCVSVIRDEFKNDKFLVFNPTNLKKGKLVYQFLNYFFIAYAYADYNSNSVFAFDSETDNSRIFKLRNVSSGSFDIYLIVLKRMLEFSIFYDFDTSDELICKILLKTTKPYYLDENKFAYTNVVKYKSFSFDDDTFIFASKFCCDFDLSSYIIDDIGFNEKSDVSSYPFLITLEDSSFDNIVLDKKYTIYFIFSTSGIKLKKSKRSKVVCFLNPLKPKK